MQISLNTYKPYTQNYNALNQTKSVQKHNINFTSGYGAEEFNVIDNPDLTPRSNGERWRNIAKAIKMMTIDHYKETHGIFPEKPKPLFTEEEFKKYRDSFYEGTDAEGMDPEDLVPGNPYDEYIIDDYSPASDVED